MGAVSVHITQDTDDGYESGSLGLTGIQSWRCGVQFGNLAYPCLRFLNITVPQGANITNATITCKVTSKEGTPDTTFYGVDVDNAAAFSDPSNMPSAAPRTTASIDADPAATGTHVMTVTGIVQEIVNRAGWASGNALAFVGESNATSGFNYWEAEDYGAAGADEAVLDITYTVASAAGPLVAGKLVGRGILGGRLIA